MTFFASLPRQISIHAPARGATRFSGSSRTRCADFNPRSREGSDTFPLRHEIFWMDFNPRSREGSDKDIQSAIEAVKKISIHAPARGATVLRGTTMPAALFISIHAPARGATSFPFCLLSFFKNFNPRSREGSDNKYLPWFSCIPSFQSTLPRGERRRKLKFYVRMCNISIHAPARGATFIRR